MTFSIQIKTLLDSQPDEQYVGSPSRPRSTSEHITPAIRTNQRQLHMDHQSSHQCKSKNMELSHPL
jgi:hypothetical protein